MPLQLPAHQKLIERFPGKPEGLENLRAEGFWKNLGGKEFFVWKLRQNSPENIWPGAQSSPLEPRKHMHS